METTMRTLTALLACVLLLGATPATAEDGPLPSGSDAIETIVVYSENRGFVHLLPDFPGAFGIGGM